MNHSAKELLDASDRLARSCNRMHFAEPVAFVYNPLIYAREAKKIFLQKYAKPITVIFLG